MKNMERKVELNRMYRHFKGKFYYTICFAKHSETKEDLVVYQALYEPYLICARPVEMFLEEVPSDRKDNITNQKYRFELCEGVL